MKMLSALLFVMFFCVTDIARRDPLIQMLAVVLCCSVLLILPQLFQLRLKRLIQREFPGFLGKVILEMKAGNSFRGAIDKHLSQAEEIWEQWLRSMIESRVFLHTACDISDAWWSKYLQELQAAEENPHMALTRLENFRQKLRVLSEFRRKSGQALAQARIQMVVMTVLYLALLAITMTQFQITSHRRIIFASLGLFGAGQVLFWWIGQKRTWKT